MNLYRFWAYYIWPQTGDWESQPVGEFIPIRASRSTNTSSTFLIDREFDFPTLWLEYDDGMPLDYIEVDMNWYRLYYVSETGWQGYEAKIGFPGNLGDQSWRGSPIINRTVTLNGEIDTDVVSGRHDYSDWFRANIHFPTSTPVPYPVISTTPIPPTSSP